MYILIHGPEFGPVSVLRQKNVSFNKAMKHISKHKATRLTEHKQLEERLHIFLNPNIWKRKVTGRGICSRGEELSIWDEFWLTNFVCAGSR